MNSSKESIKLDMQKAAQHSVHPTGGSLRVFKQVAWLQVGSVKAVLPRPAHPRVTLTVRRHNEIKCLMKRVVAVLALLITIMSASCSVLKSQMIPEPTLTTVESKRLVRDLLENNAGCQLPCWWGITPGKTTWAEARSFLESFAVYIGETGLVRVPLPAPYSNATYMDHAYSIKNGIIDIIYIYNYNLAPNYYLPKFCSAPLK